MILRPYTSCPASRGPLARCPKSYWVSWTLPAAAVCANQGKNGSVVRAGLQMQCDAKLLVEHNMGKHAPTV